MTPADIEDRLRKTEQNVAVMDAAVTDLKIDVHDLGHVPTQIATVNAAINGLTATVTGLTKDITEIRDALAARDKSATDERRALRVALVGLTSSIIVALITGLFAYLAA